VSVDADPGPYPHLVLRATLHDRDTNGFASALSDRLGISRERITWAGTKDKRAVTTQLFAVKDYEGRPDVELPGADLEVVGRAGRPVLFGDLRGNAFEIVVREVERPEAAAAVTDQLAAFAGDAGPDIDAGPADDDRTTVGVPNLFGPQRFGSLRAVTHEVGLAVARGDWRGAVLAYLGDPDDREPAETRRARAYVDEQAASPEPDWRGAVERFPERMGYERAMAQRLAEGEGPRAALEAVPSNLQRLFVHAAQSYLFNRTLSARLDRGLPFDRPVAGDVVCFTDDAGLPDPDRLQRVDEGRVATVTRHCERGRAFVTAPLVGTDTRLGDGEPGEIERTVLEEAGLEPSDFDLPGEFGSTGTRRAVLVRTGLAVEPGARGEAAADALTVRFALPKGSYATVLLREYLKTDPATMG
jgi:tRNA pseudouridine13 synthase